MVLYKEMVKKIKLRKSGVNVREVTASGRITQAEWDKLMKKFYVKDINT